MGTSITSELNWSFYCMQPALLYMRQQGYGRIINISSISREGNIGQANYAATKAGVVGLTKRQRKKLEISVLRVMRFAQDLWIQI